MSESAVAKKDNFIVSYFKDFGVLKETRSEYWGIQIINFLDCTIYFALIAIVAVFLSDDLGLSDKQAGYSITIFTTATTLCLFFSGMVTDWLGIKKSIFIAMGAMLALRLGLALVGLMPELSYRGGIATALLFLMAPFMAMLQTVFQAANRRFTTGKSRSAGFNLWYLFMNLGAMAGGLLIDFIRKILNIHNSYIFITGVILAALCILISIFLVRREEQLLSPEDAKKKADDEVLNGKPKTEKIKRKTPFQIAREVLRESTFWKLLVLIALLLGVRAVFTYMYLLAPKYWLRTIGPDVAMGTLQAINPFLIVIGLILFIPLANKFNIFKMLVYGSMISAVSLFPLAMSWQLFSADIATAHYIMALTFLVMLTVGEIIWSPKLSEYTAAIAPPGQEGTYLGLTMVPWFLAKTMVSLMSGHMLEKWCPETVRYKIAELTGKAQASDVSVKELTNQLDVPELGAQATHLGIDLTSMAPVQELTAQVNSLGYDAAQIVEKANLNTLAMQLKDLGLNAAELTGKLDPGAFALKLKLVGHQIAEMILQTGGTDQIDTVAVNLQLPLKYGWLGYWESPQAMWLVLGIFGLGGAITARLLGPWLTKGARWKIDHEKDQGGFGNEVKEKTSDTSSPIKPE